MVSVCSTEHWITSSGGEICRTWHHAYTLPYYKYMYRIYSFIIS